MIHYLHVHPTRAATPREHERPGTPTLPSESRGAGDATRTADLADRIRAGWTRADTSKGDAGQKRGGNGDGFIGYDLPIFGERPEALADSAFKGWRATKGGLATAFTKGCARILVTFYASTKLDAMRELVASQHIGLACELWVRRPSANANKQNM